MEFTTKYHEDRFPEQYASKHQETFARRLNDNREQALLRRCLAQVGDVDSMIDVGCGPGRFWPTILATGTSRLSALDLSHSMLRYARDRYGSQVRERFALAQGSVTGLPFADDAFDCVVSMRLLHHFGEIEKRRQALSELARISRRYVVVSLWTDGNYKAWRRHRMETGRAGCERQNRHIVSRSNLAADFAAAGLKAVRHFDLIPLYSQWRYYVLERVDA